MARFSMSPKKLAKVLSVSEVLIEDLRRAGLPGARNLYRRVVALLGSSVQTRRLYANPAGTSRDPVRWTVS